ncbi:efflux transporter outer membrane subunit [Vibrio nitrifigilis]|uniref:Efflux transporter outer membrane subunit n=1 Tax=Vibrio nitrifigilis TaxID=2789781 RepID=A0ABS0GDY5_9VIBR|nr:efflux transporter outer membrane subunit [Vibrio nitrifigilis]MBF9000606.1 efflux transporter outer membrane subunit [Vibrio nitrifigilis]
MNTMKITTLALTIALVSGCANHTQFSVPDSQVPNQWQHTKESSQKAITDQWWKQFNDPQLNQLIEQVLNTNNDLAIAALTLRQARLEARLDESDLYPDLSSTTSVGKDKYLDSGQSSKSYSTDLSVSYELDLWGKLSRAADASEWSAMASREDLESTAQSLVATTAQLYWQVGYLTERLQLSASDIKDAKETLALTKSQYKNGSVSRLNILEAQRALSALEATHSDYVQQLTEAHNALAILFNQPPQKMGLDIQALPDGSLPDIEPGIPAELLTRRPDVKSALYSLKSALATQDSTNASYFPDLTLTGALGGSSTQLRHLLSDPIGSLGADLTLPFLNWNEMQINKDIAKVKYQSAIVTYRKTLYEAFEDVDNALSARINYQVQQGKLQEQYNASAEAERIYRSQYQHGAIGITDLLDAQENTRSAKASLLENRYNQLVNLTTIYQSLGGPDVVKSDKTLLKNTATLKPKTDE